MAASNGNGRTIEAVRQDIAAERVRLTAAIEDLRQAADVTVRVRARLPLAAAGAAGAGFVLSGGIGATMRYFARRSRER